MSLRISPRNTQLYYLTQFLHSLIFTIPIMIVFLQRSLPVQDISFLVGLQYACQLLAELPTGAFADIVGRKYSMLLGFLVSAACSFLLPFVSLFWQFAVIFAIFGVGDSLLSGATDAWIYDSLKQDGEEEKYAVVAAKQGILYQLGLVVGTLSGGFLYTLQFQLPFFGYSIPLLIGAIACLFMYEPEIETQKFTIRKYILQMKDGIAQIQKNTYIKQLSLFYVLVGGISWSCALYFNQFMLIEAGFGNQMRGVIEAGLRLCNIFLLSNLLRNEKIFTKKRTFIFFPILMIIALLPGHFLSGWFAVPFVAMAMMSSTARWIILGKYANQEFDSSHRATALSALSMAVGILYISLTVISGYVIANLGGVKTMYSLMGIVTLVIVLPLGIHLAKKSE